MKCSGKIKNINHIVVSDPTYENDTKCRYEISNLNEKDWLVELDVYGVEENIGDYTINGIEFYLLLQKEKGICEIDGDNIKYLSNIKTEKIDIGMDTACIALGINEKAKEIINSQSEWQPKCAIRTGTDGKFGEVFEGKKGNELSFVLITGYIGENTDYGVDELFNYLVNKFEITDLIKEETIFVDKDRELIKGDKVEISFCHITNDIGGSTMIKTKDYVDEIDGMNLTVHQPDGTIEKTTIHTDYSCVDLPIEVEVISGYYDYETGYRYKGKISNERLLEEFRKIGTTGYTPEHYKKYENKKLYEDTKKAAEEYDPSIVYFSEFDVIKKLNKEASLEAGI